MVHPITAGLHGSLESLAATDWAAREAHVAEVLLGAASQAGLMVVGRLINRPAVGPRLGHVAHALLHHAACPVAVVPHP